jgi:biopolymer transport protein ExbB
MWVLFCVWVLMFALILERLLFWLRRGLFQRLPRSIDPDGLPDLEERVEERAERNLSRIDGLSHMATSLGLFGTVLGISKAFFARGADLALAAPEVLASGMATALFTTVAGLAIFLVGQAMLLLFGWWTEASLRHLRERAGR